MKNEQPWVMATKRTDDPKLAYIERRLDAMGVEHRRNGHSFHAPIMEVREGCEGFVDGILSEPWGDTILDEVADDDPSFV